MYRHLLRRTSLIATLLIIALLPLGMRGALAQDTSGTPGMESELAPQLPAVDLPTMNSLSYTFQIDSEWQGNSGSTPAELPVYQYASTNYSEDQVQSIAEALGVDGEVTSQGEHMFTIEGDGSIYTTPGLLQFVSDVSIPDEEIPGDEEAITFAREWLRVSGLLPANINNGEVIARIDSPARKVIGFQPTAPSPLLSSSPGITVTVGPAGTILEARVSWATIEQGETYRLREVTDAFQVVASHMSYLDVSLPADAFPQGSTITGSATYDSVAVAWTTSGAPGSMRFLQPVYVFTGTVTPEGSEESYNTSAYVPAIVNELQPVG